jgi:hypothetical protein
MVGVPLVVLTLLLTAENLETAKAVESPAGGSINGPWAMAELSLSGSGAVSPGQSVVGLGGDLTLTGGFGFQVGEVRLSPTARFAIGPRQYFATGPDRFPFTVGWTPIALAMAAPDLLNDTRVTGLRLTPVVGLTVPTTTGPFEGTVPLTTLSIAGQLERRFGPVELAYRLEGSSSPCFPIRSFSRTVALGVLGCANEWAIGNRIFAEGWAGESVSLALGLSWGVRWSVYPQLQVPGCVSGTACDPTLAFPPSHSLSAQALITWVFTKRFGTTLELISTHLPPASAFSGSGLSIVSASLSFWFRTDAVLQRNWLDR